QIVLDRALDQQGVYPPVAVLPSLSRLMKDGIGAKYTRDDHSAVANQLFACYAKVQDARALSSVIGEEELSKIDKAYLVFGKMFEKHFISQKVGEARSIEQTLDLGWELLSLLPKSELSRMDSQLVEKNYKENVSLH
ncbi:MAG: V-type ATP synthase subunit B, partial [Oscillospiraceae bacterium]